MLRILKHTWHEISVLGSYALDLSMWCYLIMVVMENDKPTTILLLLKMKGKYVKLKLFFNDVSQLQ